MSFISFFFFFQAEDGIRDIGVTGVQTCALPISSASVTKTVPVLLKVNSTLALVDVLIPTCGRKTGLAVVLTSLLGQTFTDFDVTISDQTPEAEAYLDSIEIQTLVRALRWRGHRVALHRHLPRRGMAEQRNFLLEQSSA